MYHDRALIVFLGTILAEEIAKSFMIPEERAGTSELALYDSAWVLRRAEKFFEMHSSIRSFSPCSRASFETETQNLRFLDNSRTPLHNYVSTSLKSFVRNHAFSLRTTQNEIPKNVICKRRTSPFEKQTQKSVASIPSQMTGAPKSVSAGTAGRTGGEAMVWENLLLQIILFLTFVMNTLGALKEQQKLARRRRSDSSDVFGPTQF